MKRQVTDNDAFNAWFAGSVVLNRDGSPKVVYHGTLATKDNPHGFFEGEFTVFKPSKFGNFGPGIYLADSPEAASNFALGIRAGKTEPIVSHSRVFPLYARIVMPIPEKPSAAWREWILRKIESRGFLHSMSDTWRSYAKDAEAEGIDLALTDEIPKRWRATFEKGTYSEFPAIREAARIMARLKHGNFVMTDLLRGFRTFDGYETGFAIREEIVQTMLEHGFDGLIVHHPERKPSFTEYLVKSPLQLKSPFNRGTFDPSDPDILHGLRSRRRG